MQNNNLLEALGHYFSYLWCLGEYKPHCREQWTLNVVSPWMTGEWATSLDFQARWLRVIVGVSGGC